LPKSNEHDQEMFLKYENKTNNELVGNELIAKAMGK